jgi:hypothetical protein
MPATVDRCVTRIIPELKKTHPNKTDTEINQMAWGICYGLWKQGKLKRDGTTW